MLTCVDRVTTRGRRLEAVNGGSAQACVIITGAGSSDNGSDSAGIVTATIVCVVAPLLIGTVAYLCVRKRLVRQRAIGADRYLIPSADLKPLASDTGQPAAEGILHPSLEMLLSSPIMRRVHSPLQADSDGAAASGPLGVALAPPSSPWAGRRATVSSTGDTDGGGLSDTGAGAVSTPKVMDFLGTLVVATPVLRRQNGTPGVGRWPIRQRASAPAGGNALLDIGWAGAGAAAIVGGEGSQPPPPHSSVTVAPATPAIVWAKTNLVELCTVKHPHIVRAEITVCHHTLLQ